MRSFSRSALSITIFTIAFQLLTPSASNKFQVRTFSAKKGLVISVSKNSPPVAALDDAQMTFKPQVESNPILLEPETKKIRILPGLRISQREIEKPVEISVNPISNLDASVDKVVSVTPVNTQEYSQPRKPKIINFREIMNRVRGESTSSGNAEPVTLATESKPSPQAITFITPNNFAEKKLPPPPTQNITEATYEISGNIELIGATFQPQNKLFIFREINGRIFEKATLPSGDSSFNLKTQTANGFLIGELRNEAGDVIARDQRWLDRAHRNGQRVANINLKLRSVASNAAYGRTFSANGGDTVNSPIAAAKVSTTSVRAPETEETGSFELGGLLPDSSLILKAEKKGYFGSIMLANSKQSMPVKLYPQKMVSGLVDLAGTAKDFTMKDFNRYGIIWGRVSSKDGEPISNAHVEIADSQSIGPIYFNDFLLPDSALEKTGSNGMFVFLRVSKGTNVIRANVNGKLMPSRIVPVEPLFISHLDLEVTDKQKAKIVSFDAFNKSPVPSEVHFAGSARVAKTSVEGILGTSYVKSSDPFIIEMEAFGEYMPIRYHAPRVGDAFQVPQLSSDWFNSLRLNQGPEFGTIVGFVGGQRFDVFMDIDGKPHQEIYYFNAGGEIVPVPVLGGGFVIANVPTGLRTVSIVPEGSPAIYSQVLSIDSAYIAVLNKSF